MDIKEIREFMDLLAMYPDIELFEKEENGTRIMMRQRRVQKMAEEEKSFQYNVQHELVEVKAPAVGMFYCIALNKNKKELEIKELERIVANGNNRIEINPGLCVFSGEVLGTIIQLGVFPISVESPCEGIIQSAFLSVEEQCQQQSFPVDYGQTLFVIKKTFIKKQI